MATTTRAAPALGDHGGGQRAHRAGADDEHLGAVERAEHLPGLVQPGGDQRAAGAVDAGLGAGPLADPQGLLGERAELPAGGPGVLRGAQRVPDLAEDLALADDHRVQPAGHREQVRDGAVLVVHVEVRGELVQGDAGPPGEQLGGLGEAAVELVDLGVDLDPVAGGEHDRLGRVVAGDHVGEQLGDGVGGQRDPLEQVDRRAAVGQADDEDAHVVTTSASAGRGDLALLVEGQDLQLDGHVDLAHLDVVGHDEHGGREVQDAADAGGDQPVADLLGDLRPGWR